MLITSKLNSMEGNGLVFNREEIWQEPCHFAVSQFRHLGMEKPIRHNKKDSLKKIQDEIDQIIRNNRYIQTFPIAPSKLQWSC